MPSLGRYFSALPRFVLIGFLITSASAALADTVELRSKTGKTSASGTFLDIHDGQYLIETIAGILAFPIADVECIGAACPDLTPPKPETLETDRQVVLTTLDGSINVSGQLLKVENGEYVVEVPALGTLRFDQTTIHCDGPGCPVEDIEMIRAETSVPETNTPTETIEISQTTLEPQLSNGFNISAEQDAALGLMPMLLGAYASHLNLSAEFHAASEVEFAMHPGGAAENAIHVSAKPNAAALDDLLADTADFAILASSSIQPPNAIHSRIGLAQDSFVIAAHPENPTRSLTIDDIQAIYRGEVTNWAQLGGADIAIKPVAFPTESEHFATFAEVALNGDPDQLGLRVGIASSGAEMAAALRTHEGAIGFVRAGRARNLARIDLQDACGNIHSVDSFSIKSGDAVLGQSLHLYRAQKRLPAGDAEFLKFIASSQADGAFKASLFTGNQIEVAKQSDARNRALFASLAEGHAPDLTLQMLSELPRWDRLSTTFRESDFHDTTLQPNAPKIQRLISFLETHAIEGKIAVVGFATDSDSTDENLATSALAAESIANRIARAGDERLASIELSTRAYGDLAPILCTTHPKHKVINNRVEIWLRNDTP